MTALQDTELKAKHRAMWAAGDYPAMVETWLLPLGPRLVEACGIGPGQRVLDVAAGTGNASLPAAERGAHVVASDLTPELLEAGKRRAGDLDIEWVPADAEHLARATGAGLRLVSATEAPALVMDTGGGTEDRHVLEQALRDQAQAALDDACSAVPEGIAVEGELVGDPGAILVVGSRGYGPLRRVMLGSVSGKLTRSAPAPVIVHPRGRHAHSRSDASAEAETAR